MVGGDLPFLAMVGIWQVQEVRHWEQGGGVPTGMEP